MKITLDIKKRHLKVLIKQLRIYESLLEDIQMTFLGEIEPGFSVVSDFRIQLEDQLKG